MVEAEALKARLDAADGHATRREQAARGRPTGATGRLGSHHSLCLRPQTSNAGLRMRTVVHSCYVARHFRRYRKRCMQRPEGGDSVAEAVENLEPDGASGAVAFQYRPRP